MPRSPSSSRRPSSASHSQPRPLGSTANHGWPTARRWSARRPGTTTASARRRCRGRGCRPDPVGGGLDGEDDVPGEPGRPDVERTRPSAGERRHQGGEVGVASADSGPRGCGRRRRRTTAWPWPPPTAAYRGRWARELGAAGVRRRGQLPVQGQDVGRERGGSVGRVEEDVRRHHRATARSCAGRAGSGHGWRRGSRHRQGTGRAGGPRRRRRGCSRATPPRRPAGAGRAPAPGRGGPAPAAACGARAGRG